MTDLSVDAPQKVLVFGATGTAGLGVVRALLALGHDVSCVARQAARDLPEGVNAVLGDITRPDEGLVDALGTAPFDVVVSCLASRTGTPKDAWAIDHGAQVNALNLAQAAGARHFILLSAICVQKPDLPFQEAKLAFEADLIKSGMTYSIVRPTAFFKSLSGQIDRLRQGKPFLVFGDGALTACKPISDDDLGRFIAGCISDRARHNQVLPIGGPGAALTPLDQGAELFRLLEQPAQFRHVPVALLSTIYHVLRIGGWLSARLAEKAELARIGRYYATESMLVWDVEQAAYDADQTPSTGSETLFDYYADLIKNGRSVERGDHSVF